MEVRRAPRDGLRRRRRAAPPARRTTVSTTSVGRGSAQKRRSRSSPIDASRRESRAMCVRTVPEVAAKGAGRLRSTVPGLPRGRPEARAEARPPGPVRSTCRKTSPTGFSGVPPSGPATPVTATATSALQGLARAGRHRGRGLGRDRAVLRQDLSGHTQETPLRLVRVGDHAADEHVAGAGYRR